ncbi:HTH_Tnp_Tc3_2 domain-containing protein [Trichonephila clavipes]|nr:HTH_Tnp_Tc3_2 domain-containing protein [Trichonephila clavipes]
MPPSPHTTCRSCSTKARKKAIEERDHQRQKTIIKRYRRANLPQIAADFDDGPSTIVTVRNIHRNFIDVGFRNRRPTRKHVARNDESRFQLNPADGRVRVWRQPQESMDPTCQQGTIQVGGCSVMEHSFEFRYFRWPPKVPDMNIIEFIWDALQSAVQKRSPPRLTLTDLGTALQESWCQLPPALLQTLIESMPRHFTI